MQIVEPPASLKKKPSNALLQLGFRPFFLGAAGFSALSIALWMLHYLTGSYQPVQSISPLYWHAHEMIYGYALAVIAGFLLTAVKNWTGLKTIEGRALGLLFFLWLAVRLCFIFGETFFTLAFVLDSLFSLGLIVSVARPIIKVRQWKQLAILIKLLLLGGFNSLFYLQALDLYNPSQGGAYLAIYAGLYLVISIVLTIGRRVVPFFIERGVDYSVQLFNSNWLDAGSLISVIGFFICEVFLQQPDIAAYFALSVFAVNTVRLIGWHTHGIWGKSLLWSLYLALWFICTGFLLIACSHFFGISKFLGIHALAFGGIGSITLGMMARVSLGHTGRSIQHPSPVISFALGLLIIGTFTRVLLPLLMPSFYSTFIGLSALLWICAFVLFVLVYTPILIKPREDGRPG